MATEMFGGSPDELRQALLNQRAAQFATQTPQQQLGALAYKGGAGIGQALGGLFGVDVTDPEMRRLQQRQEMLKGVDLTDPASLKQGVEAAMKSNDTKLATELLTRYQAATKAALEGRKTEAEIGAKLSEKSTPEMKNAAAFANNTATPGSPEWNAAYKKKLNELISPADKAPATSELAKLLAEQAKLDPIANKATYDAYTAKIKKLTTGKSIGEEISEGLSTGLGVIGEALKPALKKEGEKTGEFAATDFNTLGSAVAAGTASGWFPFE